MDGYILYAVVAFKEDDDAVALVSASWILKEGGVSLLSILFHSWQRS